MELPLFRRFVALVGGLLAGIGLTAGLDAVVSTHREGLGLGFFWLGAGVGLMAAALIRGNTT